MGSAKSLVKGLAAGAVLAAAATLIMEMHDEKNAAKAKEAKNTAHAIGKRVAERAARLGAITKSAYEHVVDTAVAEVRGVKSLSKADLRDIAKELKAGYKDIRAIALAKDAASAKKTSASAKARRRSSR